MARPPVNFGVKIIALRVSEVHTIPRISGIAATLFQLMAINSLDASPSAVAPEWHAEARQHQSYLSFYN
jgi:hypothetical protein